MSATRNVTLAWLGTVMAVMAGAQTASPASAEALATESPLVRVVLTPKPFYKGSNAHALAGALGGLIAASTWKDEPERIAAFVQQEGINVGAIVAASFERRLGGDSQAQAAWQARAGSHVVMSVIFGITSVPLSDYRPYLRVSAHLVDASGRSVWRAIEHVGSSGRVPTRPYASFYASREAFVDPFTMASDEVADLLVKALIKG